MVRRPSLSRRAWKSPLTVCVLLSAPCPFSLLLPPPRVPHPAGFSKYELEEDVTKDLVEFALANGIYAALVEGHAAEISARRTAMENASKVRRAGSAKLCRAPGRCWVDADHPSPCAHAALQQNAKEMMGNLQMKYNRGRQAVITNELCVLASPARRLRGRQSCVRHAISADSFRSPPSRASFPPASTCVPSSPLRSLSSRSSLTSSCPPAPLADHHRCLGPLSSVGSGGYRAGSWWGWDAKTDRRQPALPSERRRADALVREDRTG